MEHGGQGDIAQSMLGCVVVSMSGLASGDPSHWGLWPAFIDFVCRRVGTDREPSGQYCDIAVILNALSSHAWHVRPVLNRVRGEQEGMDATMTIALRAIHLPVSPAIEDVEDSKRKTSAEILGDDGRLMTVTLIGGPTSERYLGKDMSEREATCLISH